MSFDLWRPYNVYIGPRPLRRELDHSVLLHTDFFAYEDEDCDDYVNILKNRFNGRTGRFPRVVAYQWVNQLNEPFDAIEELL